jgi:hypothetical protein
MLAGAPCNYIAPGGADPPSGGSNQHDVRVRDCESRVDLLHEMLPRRSVAIMKLLAANAGRERRCSSA